MSSDDRPKLMVDSVGEVSLFRMSVRAKSPPKLMLCLPLSHVTESDTLNCDATPALEP